MSVKVEEKRKKALVLSRREEITPKPRELLFYLAKLCVRILLGVVLPSARIFGLASPFGVAFVAASGAGLLGFATLVGVMAGHVLFLGVDEALHYIAAGILVYGVAFAFYDTSLSRKAWFMPGVTVLSYGICRYVAISTGPWSGRMGLSFLSELVVIGLFSRAYEGCFQEEMGLLGKLAVGITLLLVLDSLVIGSLVSLGTVAAVVAIIYFAQKGCDKGFLVGSICGIALDFSTGGIPYYTPILALAGAGSGVFWGKGRYMASLGYVFCHSATALWFLPYMTGRNLFWEALVGAVLAIFLPKNFCETAKKKVGFSSQHRGKEEWHWMKSQVVQVLENRAKAFRQLYDAVRKNLESHGVMEDATVIFRRVAERQCVKCGAREQCWVEDYENTQRALNDALLPMLERGRGEKEDFPSHFRSRCLQFSHFLAVANEELLAFLYRKQYAGRMREQRSALCEQYREIHSMLQQTAMELGAETSPDFPRKEKLKGFLERKHLGIEGDVYYNEWGVLEVSLGENEYFANDVGRRELEKLLAIPLEMGETEGEEMVFRQREKISITASILGRNKGGEKSSGDSGTWFRRPDGLFCFLLCDGMGSGEEAKESSVLAMGLLENFLKGGIDPASALETVNGALSLRGEFAPSTAVDLLTVDGFSGRAMLYKWGAAASYVRTKAGVKMYSGAPVPLGVVPLEKGAVKVDKLQLEGGDFVLLCSDGLLSGEENPWLTDIFSAYRGERVSELVAGVMAESQKRQGGEDDATIIGLRIVGSEE